jgi:hypothetical protein
MALGLPRSVELLVRLVSFTQWILCYNKISHEDMELVMLGFVILSDHD